eukprot:TRINITY_DN51200_c0_g1_i1.p1 TRINITY_DN51200_c0_g1~~TRINITY_DN51200_c0_g1_i1.p1  ORF type:complete len:1233 (+),score=401.44 TRINITY_DN51200_c0_g1_i1:78-3701(+)
MQPLRGALPCAAARVPLRRQRPPLAPALALLAVVLASLCRPAAAKTEKEKAGGKKLSEKRAPEGWWKGKPTEGRDADGPAPPAPDATPVTIPAAPWKTPKWMERFKSHGDCKDDICYYSVLKGRYGVIDFLQFPAFKDVDDLIVLPRTRPKRGSLLLSNGEAFDPTESAADRRSQYIYAPFVEDFDAEYNSSAWLEASWNGYDYDGLGMGDADWMDDLGLGGDNPGELKLFKAQRNFDEFEFDASWFTNAYSVDPQQMSGKVVIHLVNAPPMTETVVFRCVQGLPRNITLTASDMNIERESEPMGLSVDDEIAEMWVRPPQLLKPPSKGTLYGFRDGERHLIESEQNIGGNPNEWRLLYEPDAEDIKVAEEQEMKNALGSGDVHPLLRVGAELGRFQYWAVDSEGAHSAPGTVKLVYDKNRPPRAYSLNYTFHYNAEDLHSVELQATDINGGVLDFYVTELPQQGQLFLTDAWSGNATGGALGTPTGPKRREGDPGWYVGAHPSRVVLQYRPPMQDRVTADGKPQRSQREWLSFWVRDPHHAKSNTARVSMTVGANRPPVCGDRHWRNIYTNQQNISVQLNYEDPDGDQIRKLLLVRLPRDPLGDLVMLRRVSRNSGWGLGLEVADIDEQFVTLRPGDFFNDQDGQLFYVLRGTTRNQKRTGTDEFLFRAEDEYGEQCRVEVDETGKPLTQLGRAIFTVSRHDQQVTAELKAQGVGGLRAERATLGRWHLFPLWGEANKTLGAAPERAVLSSVPSHGELWSVNAQAVWDPTLPYTAYCQRWNCGSYRDRRLAAGSEVEAITLRPRPRFTNSYAPRPDLWVLYQTVGQPPCDLQPQQLPCQAKVGETDSFRFRFSAQGRDSEEEELLMHIAPAQLRKVTVTYEGRQYRDSDGEQLIVCQLHNNTNTDQVQVRILDSEEDLRLHHQVRPFFLFQYESRGYEPMKGAKIDSRSLEARHGVQGMWVNRNNTVILVPRANLNQKVHRFRAGIWVKQADGKTWTETEVIQVSVRRLNSPPTAQKVDEPITALVGRRAPVRLSGMDPDLDYLTFIIIEPPRLGVLQRDTRQMRRARTGLYYTLRKGSRVQVPPHAALPGQIDLYYVPRRALGGKFPMTDSFRFAVDDGSGVVSAPVTVEVEITGTALRAFHPKYRWALGILSAGMASGIALAALCALCRRLRLCCCCRSSPSSPGSRPHRGAHSRLAQSEPSAV